MRSTHQAVQLVENRQSTKMSRSIAKRHRGSIETLEIVIGNNKVVIFSLVSFFSCRFNRSVFNIHFSRSTHASSTSGAGDWPNMDNLVSSIWVTSYFTAGLAGAVHCDIALVIVHVQLI